MMLSAFPHSPVLFAAPKPPRPPEATQRGFDPAEGPPGPTRLLVVEDDYFVGMTIENALDEQGYAVISVVTTGEEALLVAMAERPDLVVMDIRLAGQLDGVETAIELRRQGIPSIFATAHSDPATRERAAAASPAGWLVKPFSGEELLGAVAFALRQRRN